MKSLLLLLSILCSFQAFSQKNIVGLVVTDVDVKRFSTKVKDRMKMSSGIICTCIQEHQAAFDTFSDYVKNSTNAKMNDDKEAFAKLKEKGNEMMTSILPFLTCMTEKRKGMPEIEDKGAYNQEFVDAFPGYNTSGENLETVKLRVGVYYINQQCEGEGDKFNLFSSFMSGYSKAAMKDKLNNLKITEKEVNKVSKVATDRALLSAKIICECIQGNQKIFDDFVGFAEKNPISDIGEGSAEEEMLDQMMRDIMPFVKCYAEQKPEKLSVEDVKAFENDIISIFPQLKDKDLKKVKNQFIFYFINQECEGNDKKYELFGDYFMSAFKRGK